ncbi:MAG TPA: hypothetical protein VFV19_04315 [Candidatus Polarisedimenticolaceae bacterium]|nr:hypothetical protein [Candidatus Polarisedimenticolaceae bacterium]
MPARFTTALIIYAFAAVGIFLLAVPWSPVWESATSAFLPTAAGPLLRSGFVRGFVSGLGALNVAVAWSEARSFLRMPDGGTP